VSTTLLPGLISSTSAFSRWPGQEKSPSPVIFPEMGMFCAKVCSRSMYFHIEISFVLLCSPASA